jgi:hypothetical protein
MYNNFFGWEIYVTIGSKITYVIFAKKNSRDTMDTQAAIL